jgi:hypothetical protein
MSNLSVYRRLSRSSVQKRRWRRASSFPSNGLAPRETRGAAAWGVGTAGPERSQGSPADISTSRGFARKCANRRESDHRNVIAIPS